MIDKTKSTSISCVFTFCKIVQLKGVEDTVSIHRLHDPSNWIRSIFCS